MSNVDFNDCYELNDANVQVDRYCTLFIKTLDQHAPMKQKTIKHIPPPFMNSHLKKAIFKKCTLRNKFFSKSSDKNWNAYRTQRNLVTSLKRNSIKCYFDKCGQEPGNSKAFWDMVKPFLTDKGAKSNNNIILREGDEIIADPMEVCSIFNEFFCNVASEIGFDDDIPQNTDRDQMFDEIIQKHCTHPSILNIKASVNSYSTFNFQKTNEKEINLILTRLDANTACGHDYVSAKVLKISAKHITPILVSMINKCIDDGIFPSSLKFIEIC